MDIRPPQRETISSNPIEQPPSLPLGDLQLDLPEKATPPATKKMKHKWLFAVGACMVTCALSIFGWYTWAISPVSGDDVQQKFTVNSGETPSVIAKHLEEQRLIKSAFAFELFARLHGQADSLKAGHYRVSPSQSVADIVSMFMNNQNETYNVFIPPGLTLKQLADPSIKGSFANQGFSQTEIQKAFAASYDSQLLKDKPSSASLEGYIFPETFQVKVGDSLESILARSFDELHGKLQTDGMLQKFSEKRLSIHQALTLGSIVQKETDDPASQKQVAQVFHSRLQIGMSLGSDVTFIYAAAQLGVEPTTDLDSPYNTRIHTGLPPGPVATMNYSALEAVADPAPGDYLFFVAGDDGTIHFSRSDDEHQQQVQQYCKILCAAQ